MGQPLTQESVPAAKVAGACLRELVTDSAPRADALGQIARASEHGMVMQKLHDAYRRTSRRSGVARGQAWLAHVPGLRVKTANLRKARNSKFSKRLAMAAAARRAAVSDVVHQDLPALPEDLKGFKVRRRPPAARAPPRSQPGWPARAAAE